MMSPAAVSLEKPRNARIACQKCHARKVKCSGGMPCTNCCQANFGTECRYPSRARRIKVEQSYIDGLLDEIRRLREAAAVQTERPSNPSPLPPPIEQPPSISDTRVDVGTDAARVEPVSDCGDAVKNPLLGDRPFFFPLTPEMPMLVGEATEAAFANRLRQELLGKSEAHFPRTQNVLDETICSLWNSDPPWPSPARARFLVKVAFSTVCRRFYFVRKSSTLQLLEQVIQNQATCDTLSICKLYALFALGEVYSTRTCASETQFPGIGYFVSATRMLRVLSEEPRIDCVEIILMLSTYSLAMNRRHSAYCLVAYAVRFAINMGLHLNVPKHQLPNRELQEHRNRVWWTAYVLDRSWAAMLGKPVSIQDEDVDVDLPSCSGFSSDKPTGDDFAGTDYLAANVRLTNLGAQITASIYSRRTRGNSISWRVQKALRDLGDWLQELPDPLRTAIDQVSPNATMPIVTLHLYFNQCLILASRPVLLHVFRLHKKSPLAADERISLIGEPAWALSEACIRCARRSHYILTESWINGSFPTFDFNYTQYLFSASIILAVSSLLRSDDSQNDGDEFEAAAQIMSQLEQNGNFAAREFSKQIDSISTIVNSVISNKARAMPDRHNQHFSAPQDGVSQHPQSLGPPANISTESSILTLTEPSLQDLLSQPNFDLEFLDPSILDDDFQAFIWPVGGDRNV